MEFQTKRTTVVGSTALLVLLVLSSSVVAPAMAATTTSTNTTDAGSTCPELSPADLTVNGFLWNELTCDSPAPDINVTEDWLSLYSEASYMYASEQSFIDLYKNYMKDTREIAFMKAELAIANAYQNGSISTESEAVIRAKETIRDYYSTKQSNLINFWNNQIANLKKLDSVEEGLAGNQLAGNAFIQSSTYSEDNSDGQDYYGNPSITPNPGPNGSNLAFGNRTVTLFNGETITMRTVTVDYTIKVYDSAGSMSTDDDQNVFSFNESATFSFLNPTVQHTNSFTFYATSTATLTATLDTTVKMSIVNAKPPDGTQYSGVQAALWFPHFDNQWTNLNQTKRDAFSYADSYVAGTWDSYQSGVVNISQLISRYNEIKMLADAGPNASFNDIVASLSSLGLSTPNLTSTGYMNLSFHPDQNPSVQYDRAGILMSTVPAPNGSWTIGKQYNTSLLNGTQMVATLDGNQYTINGTFQIHNVYRPNGTVINKTTITTQETTYVTTNTSELQQKLEELGETLQEIQERQEAMTADGGGLGIGWQYTGLPGGIPNPFGFLGTFGRWMTIFVVMFVALAFLSILN